MQTPFHSLLREQAAFKLKVEVGAFSPVIVQEL